MRQCMFPLAVHAEFAFISRLIIWMRVSYRIATISERSVRFALVLECSSEWREVLESTRKVRIVFYSGKAHDYHDGGV